MSTGSVSATKPTAIASNLALIQKAHSELNKPYVIDNGNGTKSIDHSKGIHFQKNATFYTANDNAAHEAFLSEIGVDINENLLNTFNFVPVDTSTFGDKNAAQPAYGVQFNWESNKQDTQHVFDKFVQSRKDYIAEAKLANKESVSKMQTAVHDFLSKNPNVGASRAEVATKGFPKFLENKGLEGAEFVPMAKAIKDKNPDADVTQFKKQSFSQFFDDALMVGNVERQPFVIRPKEGSENTIPAIQSALDEFDKKSLERDTQKQLQDDHANTGGTVEKNGLTESSPAESLKNTKALLNQAKPQQQSRKDSAEEPIEKPKDKTKQKHNILEAVGEVARAVLETLIKAILTLLMALLKAAGKLASLGAKQIYHLGKAAGKRGIYEYQKSQNNPNNKFKDSWVDSLDKARQARSDYVKGIGPALGKTIDNLSNSISKPSIGSAAPAAEANNETTNLLSQDKKSDTTLDSTTDNAKLENSTSQKLDEQNHVATESTESKVDSKSMHLYTDGKNHFFSKNSFINVLDETGALVASGYIIGAINANHKDGEKNINAYLLADEHGNEIKQIDLKNGFSAQLDETKNQRIAPAAEDQYLSSYSHPDYDINARFGLGSTPTPFDNVNHLKTTSIDVPVDPLIQPIITYNTGAPMALVSPVFCQHKKAAEFLVEANASNPIPNAYKDKLRHFDPVHGELLSLNDEIKLQSESGSDTSYAILGAKVVAGQLYYAVEELNGDKENPNRKYVTSQDALQIGIDTGNTPFFDKDIGGIRAEQTEQLKKAIESIELPSGALKAQVQAIDLTHNQGLSLMQAMENSALSHLFNSQFKPVQPFHDNNALYANEDNQKFRVLGVIGDIDGKKQVMAYRPEFAGFGLGGEKNLSLQDIVKADRLVTIPLDSLTPTGKTQAHPSQAALDFLQVNNNFRNQDYFDITRHPASIPETNADLVNSSTISFGAPYIDTTKIVEKTPISYNNEDVFVADMPTYTASTPVVSPAFTVPTSNQYTFDSEFTAATPASTTSANLDESYHADLIDTQAITNSTLTVATAPLIEQAALLAAQYPEVTEYAKSSDAVIHIDGLDVINQAKLSQDLATGKVPENVRNAIQEMVDDPIAKAIPSLLPAKDQLTNGFQSFNSDIDKAISEGTPVNQSIMQNNIDQHAKSGLEALLTQKQMTNLITPSNGAELDIVREHENTSNKLATTTAIDGFDHVSHQYNVTAAKSEITAKALESLSLNNYGVLSAEIAKNPAFVQIQDREEIRIHETTILFNKAVQVVPAMERFANACNEEVARTDELLYLHGTLAASQPGLIELGLKHDSTIVVKASDGTALALVDINKLSNSEQLSDLDKKIVDNYKGNIEIMNQSGAITKATQALLDNTEAKLYALSQVVETLNQNGGVTEQNAEQLIEAVDLMSTGEHTLLQHLSLTTGVNLDIPAHNEHVSHIIHELKEGVSIHNHHSHIAEFGVKNDEIVHTSNNNDLSF